MWINSEFSSPSWALDFPDLVPGMCLLNKSNNMCAVKYFFCFQGTEKGYIRNECDKDELSGLRQFLATESPLKMMKNDFHCMLKVLFVLELLTFLSSHFGYVEKRLKKKAKVNFKTYDVAYYTTKNCNTLSAQYLPK